MATRDVALIDALEGKSGRSKPQPGDTDYLNGPTIVALRALIAGVGVRGDAEVYVARLFRYYLGAGMYPPAPTSLRGKRSPDDRMTLDDWVALRAWRSLDEHRDRLPPLVEDRAPRSVREQAAGVHPVGRMADR